jgi:hypothetical protein
MTTDVNGCSTAVIGKEQYETYSHPNKKGVTLYQYDYRMQTGQLFSCVRESLDKCRAALAVWMVQNDL